MRKSLSLLFIVALASGAAIAEPQQRTKVHRIGYLASASGLGPLEEVFRQGLRELGYVEGKNIFIEYRFAEGKGKGDHLRDLAAELVRLKVEVIVTPSTLDAVAAQRATRTIPIVIALSSDPVGTRLVQSLARPGGNITGLTTLSPELNGKRLELLKEVVPRLSRVAVLWNAASPDKALEFEETQVTARSLRVLLQSLEVRGAKDFESAFRAATRERTGALLTLTDALTISQLSRIAELAAKSRLAAIFSEREFVDGGGLISYGPSSADLFRRAATYVDKILKGANPADLPVEQPTKFELVINLKTAKALGLTIPPEVLVRADKVLK
ncbi:ABC transporter substrate-binding protein [bacterium]|nr:MAG: ABC transporter substrate-binding protein [bacterium]